MALRAWKVRERFERESLEWAAKVGFDAERAEVERFCQLISSADGWSSGTLDDALGGHAMPRGLVHARIIDPGTCDRQSAAYDPGDRPLTAATVALMCVLCRLVDSSLGFRVVPAASAPRGVLDLTIKPWEEAA